MLSNEHNNDELLLYYYYLTKCIFYCHQFNAAEDCSKNRTYIFNLWTYKNMHIMIIDMALFNKFMHTCRTRTLQCHHDNIDAKGAKAWIASHAFNTVLYIWRMQVSVGYFVASYSCYLLLLLSFDAIYIWHIFHRFEMDGVCKQDRPMMEKSHTRTHRGKFTDN